MRRVVIDNCALDPFVDRPGAYEVVRDAIDRGDLEILYVHSTLEEAASTPDPERRIRLLLVLAGFGRLIESHGFVIGESRLDLAMLSDDAGAAVLEALASRNLTKHGRDALAAASAQGNGCGILTEDVRLTRRARELGIEVLSPDDLLAEFGF
jgi:hypothetical protein